MNGKQTYHYVNNDVSKTFIPCLELENKDQINYQLPFQFKLKNNWWVFFYFVFWNLGKYKMLKERCPCPPLSYFLKNKIKMFL